MFLCTKEGNYFYIYFSKNVTKTCSNGLKISKDIDIKYFFHF